MIKSKDDDVPADPVPTDVEIDSAVERLSPDWARAVPRPHNAGASYVVQRLAHGRSHAVILEIKRSPRKPGRLR